MSSSSSEEQPATAGRATGLLRSALGRWWVAFSLSSIFVVSGHLMIKAGLNSAATAHGAGSIAGRIAAIILQPEVLAGLAIYMLGTVCWMIAVSQKEISFLYPLSSVNYVLVVAASAVMLSESVSLRRVEGIALIVLGTILLNRNARGISA